MSTPQVCALCKRPNPPKRASWPCGDPATCARGPAPHRHRATTQPQPYRTYAVRSLTGAIAYECARCAGLDQRDDHLHDVSTDNPLALEAGDCRDPHCRGPHTLVEGRRYHGRPVTVSVADMREARREQARTIERLGEAARKAFDPRAPFSLDPAHYAQPFCTSALCARLHARDEYARNEHLRMLLTSALTPVTHVQPAPEVARKREPVGNTDPLDACDDAERTWRWYNRLHRTDTNYIACADGTTLTRDDAGRFTVRLPDGACATVDGAHETWTAAEDVPAIANALAIAAALAEQQG